MGSINTQQIFRQLLKNTGDVDVTAEQALDIWEMFANVTTRRALGRVTKEQVSSIEARAFLQAAFMSAIEGSAVLNWFQKWTTSAIKLKPSLMDVLKFLVSGFRDYYQNYNDVYKKGTSATIYAVVVLNIVTGSSAYFQAIQNDILDQFVDMNEDRASTFASTAQSPRRPPPEVHPHA